MSIQKPRAAGEQERSDRLRNHRSGMNLKLALAMYLGLLFGLARIELGERRVLLQPFHRRRPARAPCDREASDIEVHAAAVVALAAVGDVHGLDEEDRAQRTTAARPAHHLDCIASLNLVHRLSIARLISAWASPDTWRTSCGLPVAAGGAIGGVSRPSSLRTASRECSAVTMNF